jgi:uncharacterized protein
MILALDRAMSTAPFAFDRDGRLRVTTCAITKACVNPYHGDEIPGWEELGLDPNKIYKLLRDPEELEKAAPTFNGLPLLLEHRFVTASSLDPTLVVGTIGSDAKFEHPHLTNGLVVWTKDGIDLIKSGVRKALSASYKYSADMTPGEFDGVRYDGVMRGIVGNHVALVPKSRSEIVVGDIALMRRPAAHAYV